MRALITEKIARLSILGFPQATADLREAAVLLPLVDHPNGITLLLAQRTQHLHHHPGQIGLPGGGIEATDADPVAAALRETHEEIGIAPDRVEVVGQLEPVATRTGFRITPIVGFIAPPFELKVDPFEVEHVLEIPLEFFLEPHNYRRQTRRFDVVGDVTYYALDYDGHFIWGATAQILANFARHLGVNNIPD